MSTTANTFGALAGDPRKVGKAIIKELNGRKGFGWWFGDIDSDIQKEITEAVGLAALKAIKK